MKKYITISTLFIISSFSNLLHSQEKLSSSDSITENNIQHQKINKKLDLVIKRLHEIKNELNNLTSNENQHEKTIHKHNKKQSSKSKNYTKKNKAHKKNLHQLTEENL